MISYSKIIQKYLGKEGSILSKCGNGSENPGKMQGKPCLWSIKSKTMTIQYSAIGNGAKIV